MVRTLRQSCQAAVCIPVEGPTDPHSGSRMKAYVYGTPQSLPCSLLLCISRVYSRGVYACTIVNGMRTSVICLLTYARTCS